jgi:sensor histidine kinase YesM
MDTFFSNLALSDHRGYRLGRHFLFWFVCWVFMGFIYGFIFITERKGQYIALSYFEAILYMPQHMLLSYGLMYFILPKYITKEKYWSAIGATLLLIFVVAFMSPLIVRFVINPIRTAWLIVPRSEHGVFYSLMAGLRGSMTVAGFAVAIKLIKLWYQKKTDNERLEREKLKAELEILKGQLHPHFMFNTLNSIYSLALKKSDNTADAIIRLSNLMRFILTECNSPTIELQKEVEILGNYIELEKVRFGKRLDISINVSGEVQSATVPPLLLMPFLENSFKHGANEMTELAWVSLDLHVSLPVLTFKLINGKPAENSQAKDSFLVGLANVQRRLQLLYPNSHELRITEDPDTFVVVLVIQLDKLRLPDAS